MESELTKEVSELIHFYERINLKIAAAESISGGLFSKAITDIPGSSSVFNGSLITYSNESKIRLLNVSENTILKYGAVSKEVAYEMLKGLLKKRIADVGVVCTGIAGPANDNLNKPIGLVYIAAGILSEGQVKYTGMKNNFIDFGREYIREQTVLSMIDILLSDNLIKLS